MTDSTNTKKLYRSGAHQMIGGVCAGVSDYLHVDPTIVRILWLLSVLVNGIGIVGYVICLVFVPLNPEHAGIPPAERKKDGNFGLFVGIAVVFIGVMFLFNNFFNFIWPFHWRWYGFWPFRWDTIWPLIIIGFGAWYIYFTLQKDKKTATADEPSGTGKAKLYRSRSNRMVAGVCGGLSRYWNVDVNIVRIGFVILTFLTHIVLGFGIYVALIMLAPEEELTSTVAKTDKINDKPDNSKTTEVQNA